MPKGIESLLSDRNMAPLDDRKKSAVINTFRGIDPEINAHYEESSRTLFRVLKDEFDVEYGDISFGPDIFPGTSNVNPNASLSMKAAVAHEISHCHRWQNQQDIDDIKYRHLDEALTSLDAIIRNYTKLDQSDIQGLVADAMLRISLYIKELEEQ